MTDVLDIELITDDTSLAGLADEWEALRRRSPAATPFSSPDWLVPWWRHFRPGELRTIAIRGADGRLLALAPLWLEDGPFGRRLLPLGIGVSDCCDVLVDPAEPGAGTALLHAVTGLPGWDVLSLEDLAPGAAALTLPTLARLRTETADHAACPLLRLDGPRDPDGLPLTVPAKQRRNHRRALASASRHGSPAVVASDDAPDRFLDELFRLHGARWRSKGEAGMLATETVRAFLRDAVSRLAARGLARLRLLTIDRATVGAHLGFREGRWAAVHLTGFDPVFSRAEPGTILTGTAIREAAAEGASTFDFLRGREHYKYLWGAHDRWTRRLLVRRA